MVTQQPEDRTGSSIEDVAGSVASGTDLSVFTQADFEDALSRVLPVVAQSTSETETIETSE